MVQTKPKTKRLLGESARRAALDGQWEEAIALNQEIIERFQPDAEAYNRLGRAYLALDRLPEAAEAYSNSLRVDPANLIARRNLQRLDVLRHRSRTDGSPAAAEAAPGSPQMPRTNVFIEEVGKTWVDELVNPAPLELLAEVLPGEAVALVQDGDRLIVRRKDGRVLGEVEAKTAERVRALLAGGNRYEAYALGLSGQSLRVILREVYHHPALAGTVSFPRQITSRSYFRERDLLRQRDEADFLFLDEDDEEDEDETVRPDVDEEEASEPDAEPFIEDTVTVVDEEEPSI